MLNNYLNYNKKIYIMGHDNPDVDSVLSGLLLSKYLSFKNINNSFIIPNSISDLPTIKFLNKLGVYPLDLVVNEKDILGKDVFLVDHFKTKYDVNVLGVIDHHKTSEKFNYDFHFYEPSASCCRLIYDFMKNDNYKLSEQDYLWVLYSIVLDTNGCRNTKFTEKDKEIIDFICSILNLNLQSIIDECTLLTDLSQSMSKIVENGFKSYNIKNHLIYSSYIEVKDLSLLNIYCYSKHIQKTLTYNKNVDFWIFIIIDYNTDSSYVYRISTDNILISFYDKVISRGNDIILNLEQELS